MERIHPESYRQLEQLVLLHGVKLVRAALDEIAARLAKPGDRSPFDIMKRRIKSE